MKPASLVLTLGAGVLLSACGGGGDATPAANAAGSSPSTLLASAREAERPQAATAAVASFVSLSKVSETRVNRTVYDLVYKVTFRNGPVAQAGLVANVTGAGSGTTVLDGQVVVGDLAADASAMSNDTIALRLDRSQVFDANALIWSFTGTPVRTVVFDPALCAPQAGAPYGQTVGIRGTNIMVTSADVQASAAGCRILAAGGSASDAAVAVQAVLGVVEPFASGLAGGAVITYYDAAAKKVHTYDGLASSPANIGATTTTSIYQMAVATDLSCRSGQSLGGSISAQQGNTNISGRATGVPGTVKVLDLVHGQYGRKPWNTLWDDAIGLATNGFPMTKYMYHSLYSEGTEFDDETGEPLDAGGVKAWYNNARDRWGSVRCRYKDIKARYCDLTDATEQKPLPVGTLIKNAPLATTMAHVRDGGAAAFYDPNGPVVASILQRFLDDKYQRGTTTNNCTSILPGTYNSDGTTSAPIIPARIPSLMAASDFTNYRAVERKPLVGTRFGLTIHTQPAPLFGGVVQLYSLGLLERKNVQTQAFGSAPFLYLAGEASRLANADRRAFVGDPAYSNVNARVNALLSPTYLDARAALINGTALGTVSAGTTGQGIPVFAATDPAVFDPLASLGRGQRTVLASARATRGEQSEDMNTTSSLAIIDGYGNALAMTTTINTHWGAHIEAGGMMLNNAMSNFSASMPGSDVNGYAANKRPRSSISPSIALDAEGRLRMVWGSAGGGPIPDYIVKTFLGHAVYGMDIQAAINADNWSGQALGSSVLQVESGTAAAALVPGMRSTYGYSAATLAPAGLTSGLAGISVEYDGNGFPVYRGAADYRRAGGASGY